MLNGKKGIISVLLIISIVVALLTGCFNDEGADGAEQTDGGNTENLDPLSKEAAEQNFEEVLSKVETPEYFKNTPTYEYTFQLDASTAMDDTFGERFFEKKFNVKANFIRIEGGNRKEQLNLMFATGTVPDLVVATLPDIPEYAKQGLLAEIPVEMIKEHMPGYYAIIQKYDPGLLKITKLGGKNMAIARLYPNGGIPYPAAIRADWLKNVGINKLPETLDELEDAFIKFRNNDPDQNGKKDTYALSSPSDFNGELWFQSIFGAFGANPFLWVEKDGKLQFGLTTKEAKQALKRLNEWYEMELIDLEFITDKGKSVDQEDIAAKFAKNKLGYMDNLNFTDLQWDFDGHINFKWVSNHPQWQQWFKERQDNPEEYYSMKVITDFTENVVEPYYIAMPPVKGPNGAIGNYRIGNQRSILVFGKQLEDEPEKFEKLLKILEHLNQDKDTYLVQSWGPEGFILKKNEQGELSYNPDWTKHELYSQSGSKLGAIWTTNPMRLTNPDWLGAWGGPRDEQRFKKTADVVRDYPYYENKLKVA
jgi:putative aldouronate transport system substrate-binding protein